jgi:hypothetical protein
MTKLFSSGPNRSYGVRPCRKLYGKDIEKRAAVMAKAIEKEAKKKAEVKHG